MAFDLSECCAIDGCEKPKRRREWCGMHYQRFLRHGTPGEPEPRCAANGTGRMRQINGYIAITRPGHPLATGRYGRVYEHRYLAWEAGLFDDPLLHVHHVNGDRADNRIENLVVMDQREHARFHGVKHTGCSVDECDRSHYGLGLCHLHWQQERRSKKRETT